MRASLPLPPGDIYNLTVTACTERSRNTSVPNIIKLGQNRTGTHTHCRRLDSVGQVQILRTDPDSRNKR